MNSANENKHGSVGSSKINIWFAPIQPLYFQIKHAMKTALQNYPIHPALFQIAALIDIPTAPRVFESAPVITESVFASLRREAAKSKTTKNKNGSGANVVDGGFSKRRAMRTDFRKNGVTRKSASGSVI